MARVHRLEHVHGLGASDLTHDDAVGAHTQGVAQKLADPDLAGALDVRRARLERDHVVLLELELGGVLDRHDALVSGDVGRHRVQQRRLTGTGTAGDEDVELPLHAGGQEVRRAARDRAELDEVVHRVRVARELPDRERRPAERERRDDRVHTAPVREAGVDHRRGLVDATADLGDDLVDDAHDVRVVDERRVRRLELARALDVHLLGAVDHDLRHGVVAEERLERPVAEDVVGDVGDDLAALLARQRRPVEGELLHDRAHDALFEVLRRLGREQLGAELGDARVMDAGLQFRVGILPTSPPVPVLRLAGRERRRLGGRVLRDEDGAVDAIVETHG